MPDIDGVLDAIDSAVRDYSVSADAMRWAPDEPDPTPRNALVDHLAEWVEERTGFQLMEWQRHSLNTLTPAAEADAREMGYSPGSVVWSGAGWPIIRDDAADVLEWSSTITPAREALVAARELADWASSPPGDGLLRITMPDASESLHLVVAVTPGETPGSYVLTLDPASLPPETPAQPEEETTDG